MAREINDVEDILADDAFRAWYHKKESEEAQQWASWIEANPSKIYLVEQAVQLMQAFPADQAIEPNRTEAALEKLRHAQSVRENTKKGTIIPFWRWAAAAAAVFLVAFWAVRQYNIQNAEESWLTAFGQTDTVLLADGSEVILNANSKLTGRNLKKGNRDRELWIDGEAFFTIASTGNGQRMLVHTSAGDVVVTGTQFNIQDRNNGVSVLLTEGSVHIRDKSKKEWPLKPGEMATIENDKVTVASGDLPKVLAWKKGMLVLERMSVEEFATLIKDYYGKEVIIEGHTNETVSGLMPNNRLDNLLRAAIMVTNWKIESTGESIVIVVN